MSLKPGYFPRSLQSFPKLLRRHNYHKITWVWEKKRKQKVGLGFFLLLPTGRETPSVLGCREFLEQMMQSLKLHDWNEAKPALHLHVYSSWQSDFVQCPQAGVHSNSSFKIPSIIYILCHKNPGYLLSKRVTAVEQQQVVAIPCKHLQKQAGIKCD